MNDPVFLDSAAFLRVWQRVTGEAGITAAPEQPETDPLTAQLRGCICAKAAGTAFYAALAQLDAAADAVPMPLRETLRTMAQQDARHAQRVRMLLTGLIF